MVAALLALSVPNIRQNPQDTSNFYLAHIYQQLSTTQPNGSQPSIPSSLSNPTEPYSPPTSGVWVNGLWFLSLVISLTCALLATLLQHWARRYLRVAHPHYGPHKRARIRAFYKHGVEKLHIPWVIELLPTLLHLSLFLFFSGLSVFLFGVNLTIFKVVTAWIGVCVILYACLTFLPVIRKDSPYSSPLSASVSFYLTGIRYVFFRFLSRILGINSSACMVLRSRNPRAAPLDDFFSYSMGKTAEKFAISQGPDIDYRSLLWTFGTLDNDKKLEKFFEALPRLCDSVMGKTLDLQQGFIRLHKKKLSTALIGLMSRTLTSNLVTEFVKQRRMIICTKVINSTSLLGPWWILRCVLLGGWSKFLECIEFGLFVLNWKNITDKVTTFYAQCVAVLTISILRDRDERWLQLAAGLLKVSNFLLDKYIAHGDSILLANAIFIVRRTIQIYSGAKERHRSDILDASSKVLKTVCKLDIRNTLPELQHEFCGLWNQLVHIVKTDERAHHVFIAKMTLKNIHKLYIALHASPGTSATADCTTTDDPDALLDNPEFYSMCTLEYHCSALPIPDLQFDEPDPEAPPTPNIMPMPTPSFVYPSAQPAFPSPYSSSSPPAPYLSVPSSFPDQPSRPAAPSLDATVRFPEPPFARSRASPPPPPPPPSSPPPPPLPSSSSFPSHDVPFEGSHLEHYHSTIPLPDSEVPFPSQLAHSYASNVSREGNVQSP